MLPEFLALPEVKEMFAYFITIYDNHTQIPSSTQILLSLREAPKGQERSPHTEYATIKTSLRQCSPPWYLLGFPIKKVKILEYGND